MPANRAATRLARRQSSEEEDMPLSVPGVQAKGLRRGSRILDPGSRTTDRRAPSDLSLRLRPPPPEAGRGRLRLHAPGFVFSHEVEEVASATRSEGQHARPQTASTNVNRCSPQPSGPAARRSRCDPRSKSEVARRPRSDPGLASAKPICDAIPAANAHCVIQGGATYRHSADQQHDRGEEPRRPRVLIILDGFGRRLYGRDVRCGHVSVSATAGRRCGQGRGSEE